MRFALLFGNDQYEDAAINDLTHALSDMSNLKSFLGSELSKESRFKVDSLFNPKSEQVEKKLSRMLNELKNAEKTLRPGERNLALFFFAGHGVTVGTETRLLCSNATELSLSSPLATSGSIRLDLVRDIARALPATDFVVWLDVCRSIISGRGAGSSVTLGGLRDVTCWAPTASGALDADVRRLVLASCDDGQTASDSGAYMDEALNLMREMIDAKREVVLDSRFSETLGNRLRKLGLRQKPTANGRPVVLVPGEPAAGRAVASSGGRFDPALQKWWYVDRKNRDEQNKPTTPKKDYTELCALISSGVLKGFDDVWTPAFGKDAKAWRKIADLPYFAKCLPESFKAPRTLGVPRTSPGSQWRDTKFRPAGTRRVLKIAGCEYGLCWRPACTFTMGSRETERGRGSDELQHKVTLTRGAWVLETLVTQRLWMNVMGSNPSTHAGEELPVYNVTYADCLKFLVALNKRYLPEEGLLFRLPTEAEWECAARAGTQSAFCWGALYDKKLANCHNHRGGPTSVKRYPPNPWGLYDVHGALREWTSDFYAPYSAAPATDPAVERGVDGAQRVVRGGDWRESPEFARSACRLTASPRRRSDDIGLRFVLSELVPWI